MTMRLWIRQLFTRSATRTLRKAPRCCRPMLETLEDRLTPAVFNVTAGSVTSLAAAITFANANPGTDVIVPSGTYNLATLTTPGQLTLSANVTISGTPGSTIIEANASANTAGYRVFEIGGGTNALIDGVTISNGAISGQQGGGIAVDANATLTVDNCTVSDNFAAVGSGIANAGTLMVDICTLSDNFGTVGGGIYNTGIATLDNSTLSRNTANLEGGGINNNGTATIDNCTISGNTIISPGFGGGIYNSAMLTIDDSTVSGNTGSVAGIDASSTVTLNNTIVADAVSGNFAAGSANNLLGPGAGGGLTSGTNGNTIEASVADLGLDPSGLGINGGPTETIALESGSPAIDKGNNALVPTGVATDQRGYERIVNGTVDIGAYEFNSINLANNLVVTTTADTYSDTNTPAAPISLRQAIAYGQFLGGAQTITFAPSLTANGPATIDLSTVGDGTAGPSDFGIGTNITIDGPTGSNGVTLQNVGSQRIFYVSPTGSLTLDDLTLSGGTAQGGNGGDSSGGGAAGLGGAVFNEGSLTLVDSTLSGNTAIGGAGGTGGGFGAGGGGGGLGGNGVNNSGAHQFQSGGGGPPGGGAGGEGSGNDDGASGSGGSFGGGGGGGSAAIDDGGAGGQGGFGGGGGGGGYADVIAGGNGGQGGFGGGGGGGGADGGDGTQGGFGGGAGANAGAGRYTAGGGGGGAGLGGAVFNDAGNVTITNSTLAGNSAQGGTGANNGMGLGGALFSLNGSVTLADSTISGNTAAQGGRGVYILGLAGTASATINNTIIGQSDTSVTDLEVVAITNAGGLTNSSGTGNLIGTETGFSGTIVSTANPNLAPLGNYGGPTPTMGLLPGSPAIDAGVNAAIPPGVTNDQRGLPRIVNGTVDIGAVENQDYTPTLTVTDGGTFNGSTFAASASVTGVNGGPAASLVASALSFTYYSGSTSTGASLAGAPTTVGTYTVVATFAGTVDYDSATSTTTFNITRAAPNISLTDGGTFNGSSHPASASISGVGAGAAFGASLEGVSLSLAYYSGLTSAGASTSTAPISAGIYTVVASFPGSTDYASASPSTTFAITQATPTVSVTDTGGTFNGSGFPASASVAGVSGGPAASLEGNAPTFTYYSGANSAGPNLGSAAPSSVGTYTVVANFASTTDYASANSSTTFTITRATPIVTVTDNSGTFTGTSFAASASVTGVSGGPAASLEGTAPTFTYYDGPNSSSPSLGSTAPTSVGTYSVVANFAGTTDYTSANSSTLTFTITKATPTVTVTDAGGSVNGSAYPASDSVAGVSGPASATLEGNGLSLTYYSGSNSAGTDLGSAAPSALGTYTVVASFPGSTDYSSSSAQTTFAIFNTKMVLFQETQITAGDPFIVTATVETLTGQVETSFNGSIVLTLVNNPGGAAFDPLTELAASGQATFSNQALANPGVGYQLQAQATVNGALITAVTQPFAVSPSSSNVFTTPIMAPAAAEDADSSPLTYTAQAGGYTQVFAIEEQFGLEPMVQPMTFGQLATSDFHVNAHGGNELNLVSETGGNLANGGAYFIVPNGNLYAYDGISLRSSETTGFVASLGANVYNQPQLLFDPSNPYMPLASMIETNLDLQQPPQVMNYFFNDNNPAGTNIYAKYLKSGNNSNPGEAGYYIIVPNGNLYTWTNNDMTDTLATTPVDTLPVTYYENPALLTTPTPQGSLSTLTASVSGGKLTVTDTGFQGTAIIYVSTADGTQTFDATFTDAAPVVTQPAASSTASHLSVDDVPLTSPDTAGNAVTYSATVGGYSALFDIEQQLALTAPNPNGSGSAMYFTNTRGAGEKYLMSTNGNNSQEAGYYVLVPEPNSVSPTSANLYTWTDNSLTISESGTPMSVPLSAYNDPTEITNAQAPYNPAAFNAQSTLDLQAPPDSNYFYNTRGYGEKYFVSGNGSNPSEAGYYILTPNGNLYAWTNNSIFDTLASAPVAAGLPSYYYENPNLLFNAVPQGTPTGVTVSISGTTLQVNPNGFIGTVTVYITVSDGVMTSVKTTEITFT